MTTKNIAAYDAFSDWERKMAKKKAHKAARKCGFTRTDAEDLEQELLIRILIKRKRYDPEHKSGATQQKFMSYVLDKAISNIFQSRWQDKRAVNINPRSLDEEIKQEEGEPLAFGDLLSEERSLSRLGKIAPTEETNLHLDTKKLLGQLNSQQKEIGTLILRGYKPSEIGRVIGKARATLDREIEKMRRILYEGGLKDYL